eukprot:15433982-Alexandrium_andersonii.AAC.1
MMIEPASGRVALDTSTGLADGCVFAAGPGVLATARGTSTRSCRWLSLCCERGRADHAPSSFSSRALPVDCCAGRAARHIG